mmetsp:Transcript_14388/g.25301  ORF Transcript_14388/g.25301 Transcript_14388/m.25301 type:complete len:409 (-) Transcript_14388:92-1318(-)
MQFFAKPSKMLGLLLVPVAVAQAGVAPAEPSLRSPRLAAMAMETHEMLGAMSQTDLEVKESSLLALLVQVSSHVDDVLSNADHLSTVSEGLVGLLQRNMSAKVTAKFVDTMKKTLGAFKLSSTNVKNKHLEELLRKIQQCEEHRDRAMEHLDVHEEYSEAAKNCPSMDAAKFEYERCKSREEELKKFEAEDDSCKEWPAMVALTPETAMPDCEQSISGETYEEYLERARSAVDNKLLLYRQMKNACASRKVVDSCSVEYVKYQSTKERCEAYRQEKETKACLTAGTTRHFWNDYATCWNINMELYKNEAMSSGEFSKAETVSYMASEQIECLMDGFTSLDPKAVIRDCKEKRSKAVVPETVQLHVICPPAFKPEPDFHLHRKCPLPPPVPMSKEAAKPMDCAEVVANK